MAALLVGESATVTIAHSKSRDLPGIVRRADIVVAAVGRPEMVRGDWIKPGATVIDVGINRVATDDGKGRLVGDVAFDEAVASRRRDHPGSGRRWADDHRHATAGTRWSPRTAAPACRTRKAFEMLSIVACRRRCASPGSRGAVDAERAFARDAQRHRPMDGVSQICRPRRGDVQPAGGVGARIPRAARRTRRSRSAGGRRRAMSRATAGSRSTPARGSATAASRSAISPPSGSGKSGAGCGSMTPATRSRWRGRSPQQAVRPQGVVQGQADPPAAAFADPAVEAPRQGPARRLRRRALRRRDARVGLEGRRQGRAAVPHLPVERRALRAGRPRPDRGE